jgi:hypothetical protein
MGTRAKGEGEPLLLAAAAALPPALLLGLPLLR